MTDVRMKVASAIFLTLGALPIPVYPFVLFANLMSLGGQSTGNEPLAGRLIAYAFLWSSLAYPLVYLWFRRRAKRERQAGHHRAACFQSAAPLIYLAGVLMFFTLWSQRAGA